MRRAHHNYGSFHEQKYKGFLQRKISFELRKHNLAVDDKVQVALLSLSETGSVALSRRMGIESRGIGRYRPIQRAYLAQTEKNIVQLTRALAQETRIRGETRVSYETFETVMSGICSLWPFC
jgi:hypothetical protein